MWCCVIRYFCTGDSEEYTASTFKVEEIIMKVEVAHFSAMIVDITRPHGITSQKTTPFRYVHVNTRPSYTNYSNLAAFMGPVFCEHQDNTICSYTAIYAFLHLYSFCWPKVLTKVCTGGPPYLRIIHSKTYRGYMKPRIIPNAIYNVIFV